jgi:hypothetical protein
MVPARPFVVELNRRGLKVKEQLRICLNQLHSISKFEVEILELLKSTQK